LSSRPERSVVEGPAVSFRQRDSPQIEPGKRVGFMRFVGEHRRLRGSLFLWIALLLIPTLGPAQLSFDTNSVAPERFIAAHGRKAIVMGYASGGLELWAYPLQLISD
jgi:hypothetical protein